MRPVSGKPRKLGCVMSDTPEKHRRMAMPTALLSDATSSSLRSKQDHTGNISSGGLDHYYDTAPLCSVSSNQVQYADNMEGRWSPKNREVRC